MLHFQCSTLSFTNYYMSRVYFLFQKEGTLNVPAGNSSPFSLFLLKIINGKIYTLKDKGK